MVITFKELKFKNILSFGAQETVIQFSKGINLISGKNGSGKSAILDALSFCLFGKPYRGIKIKDLINRRNKKDTEVTCEFTIDNKDLIKIKRTINPDSLEIIKNGTEADLLSSKKLNQDELNKIIGIDYHLFKQVISLAVNYNKPFLSLPSLEKREIIEQIFNITIFGQMLKEAKKRNADNIIKHELDNNSIKILEENLKPLRKNLIEITQANEDFNKNKDIEVKNIDERILKYEEDIKIINNNLEETEKKIDTFSIESTNKIIEETKTDLANVTKITNTQEFTIENNSNTIKNLETDIVCPRCLTNLTQKHKEKEIQRLEAEIIFLEKQLNIKKIEQKEVKEHLEYLIISKQDYDRLKINKQTTIEKKNLLEGELAHLKENRQQIIDRKIDINIENINNEFNRKMDDYRLVFQNSKNIKNIIDNYESVFNILSELGIKAFFFRKLVPILNTKVNEYLQLFEIPIVLLFDEFMNEKITNYENIKNSISYNSYSEGEKKRIDMAILLSFISMTKAISNWNCNLLLIDELLDGAIDENGLDKLVTSLKNMTYESNLCIYIISHRLQQDYNSKFSKCLQIEKEDSFSKINYI